MNIHIREATGRDIAAITRLSNQLGYTIDEKSTAENLAHIQQNKDGIIYTAVDENKVAGWLHVAKRMSLESGVFYEILGLIVDEAYRNNGIGKQLVQQAMQWSRNQGAGSLRVRSNEIRKQAHKFYLLQGFAERKVQKVFEITL